MSSDPGRPVDGPFYHVGIVVADLDEAIPAFERAFQVTFNEPSELTVEVEDDGPPQRRIRVSYCRQGPPYLELMEGHQTGFLSLAGGEGVHHIGLWVPPGTRPDNTERFRALHTQAVVSGGAQLLTTPASLHGVRIELVDDSARARVESWIRGVPG